MPLRVRHAFLRCASLLLVAVSASPAWLHAQTVVPGSKRTAHALPVAPGEQRASRAFEAAKKLGAPELYAFLKPFPKGADLHMHLSGAVYAETFIEEAARQGLCVASVSAGTPALPESHGTLRLVPPPGDKSASCPTGQLPAANALTHQPLYDALVDSFSMRGYVPSEAITGHDQFFSTFDRFGGLKAFTGEWLDEVATRAAAQNEQYLEVMQTPSFNRARELGYKFGWPAGAEQTVTPAQLAKLRDALLAGGLRDDVDADWQEFADALNARRRIEHCPQVGPGAPGKLSPSRPASGQVAATTSLDPDALTLDLSAKGKILAESAPGCSVDVRFLYQVLRAFPPQQVFAQTLLAFEVANAALEVAEPMVVGINFVQPEDAHLAMRDYHLQMLMLAYLHSVYPRVRLSLHAGELALGMVPPQGLTFHIREAVELGHADRIGHGMDVLYEDRPAQLLAEMAEKHIMVEVNLTSNDVILGETRTDHPLAAYRAAGVPVALSTDDEGVARIDLTHEYVKGAEEQNLTYADLKRSARASLEHSFLRGASLWAAPDDFTRREGSCAAPVSLAGGPPAGCVVFLKASPRATQQYELERRLIAFEENVR